MPLSRLGIARTGSALPSAYRKRSIYRDLIEPQNAIAKKRGCLTTQVRQSSFLCKN